MKSNEQHSSRGGRPRILVVAPFAHQNGHFVTFPRDIACALAMIGAEVTVLHPRPFRIQLDEFGQAIRHVCLYDLLPTAPRLWREIWPRLARRPSNQCLAWIIWKINPKEYDLAVWTDFQAQNNVWWASLARLVGLYRLKTAFVEHHRPDEHGRLEAFLYRACRLDCLRLAGLQMFVMSEALLKEWRSKSQCQSIGSYIPHGLWPSPLSDESRRQARNELAIDASWRVLLVFGAQRIKGKHIDSLFRAIADLTPEKHLCILFVGAMTTSESHPFKNFRSGSRNITVRFEEDFVSEERVRTYFAATDIVWANYRSFPGASGVLLQAMAFGRMALCSSEGDIGSLCKRHRLGLLVDSDKPDHLSNVLHAVIAMPPEEQLQWEQNGTYAAGKYAWTATVEALLANFA